MIQYTLKFDADEYPALAKKYRTCKRGEFVGWLRETCEKAARDCEETQLDRIENMLDKILRYGTSIQSANQQYQAKEPRELTDALAALGF